MADQLIRNIEPHPKKRIDANARNHGHSLSDEAKALLAVREDERKLGTLMYRSIRPEDRGEDLVFEYKCDVERLRLPNSVDWLHGALASGDAWRRRMR